MLRRIFPLFCKFMCRGFCLSDRLWFLVKGSENIPILFFKITSDIRCLLKRVRILVFCYGCVKWTHWINIFANSFRIYWIQRRPHNWRYNRLLLVSAFLYYFFCVTYVFKHFAFKKEKYFA